MRVHFCVVMSIYVHIYLINVGTTLKECVYLGTEGEGAGGLQKKNAHKWYSPPPGLYCS